ncbi:uridine-cytidine kinase C [Dorcoceras hygrometricum]|uniref:Uridine-cytidine kinase C n=1 Tax=Dorcoceras hygrometricum TaxID=472368 RepID=A0A2Z7CVV9_9LAMI|nr:uridine-cytidine kinase C [Dorcoceras hygrometricum]
MKLSRWFSADDVIIFSRWFESSSRKLSAGSLYIQTQGRSDVVEEEISSRKLLFTSRCYLEIAIAKRCRLHKLIRQRFALALKIQQMLFALRSSSRKIPAGSICLIPAGQPDASNSSIHRLGFPDARKEEVAKRGKQTQDIQSTKISSEDEFSRSDKSAAKQLTIYESWMSTAELNSNGENDKKPAKEKDTSTIPCRYFTEHI